jgi:hypothetical protein
MGGNTIWYNRRTAQRKHVHVCKQQGLRGAEQKRHLACGSMVLPMYLCFFFALYERKNETQTR